jgi:hypothetical protein
VPEHLRALVFIVALAVTVFVLAKVPFTAFACTERDFVRRRNLWFGLTLAAFLAHNFWIFVLVASCLLIVAVRAESNRFALYLGVMLALPLLSAPIPGLGVVNDLFHVEPLRMLSLFVLLPTYLVLRKQPGVEPFGKPLCDKLLLCYWVLEFVLTVPHRTFTSVLRDSVFIAFTDVFLLYYVASRSLRTPQAFRDALAAFAVGAMAFCAIVAMEFARGWLLYSAVDAALGVDPGGNDYLKRSGRLRAVGTAGQSIVTGYTCAVAIGLYLYVGTLIRNPLMRHLFMLILVAGVIGAFSRAPWIGTAIMIVVFVLLGPAPVKNVAMLIVGVLVVGGALMMTPFGQVIVDHLPWVGTVDSRNVDGRERLAEVAFGVIMENPFFGRFDYWLVPAIEGLRGSDGIIDLVNTYVMIGLKGGLVSVALFVSITLVAMVGVFSGLRLLGDKRDERHALGRALIATLVGVLFIIGTVSPIFFIYPLLWTLVGLSVGFSLLVQRSAARATAGAHRDGPWGQPWGTSSAGVVGPRTSSAARMSFGDSLDGSR